LGLRTVNRICIERHAEKARMTVSDYVRTMLYLDMVMAGGPLQGNRKPSGGLPRSPRDQSGELADDGVLAELATQKSRPVHPLRVPKDPAAGVQPWDSAVRAER
jgi:hypothetical protein